MPLISGYIRRRANVRFPPQMGASSKTRMCALLENVFIVCHPERGIRCRYKQCREIGISVTNLFSCAEIPPGTLRPRYHGTNDVPGRRPPEDATSPKSRSPACEPEARSSEAPLSPPDRFPGYCRSTSAARARPNPSDERSASHREIRARQRISSVGARVFPGRRRRVR